MTGTDADEEIFNKVIQESRLPGGSLLKASELRRAEIAKEDPRRDSLVAAAGWCAPSETLYDVCFQGTTDGLVDVPEVQARRGGIRYNQGITFASIYGDGSANFFNLTEAEVAAGTTKTCIEITCPSFIDVRLGVTGICLTGNILTARAYPEQVETFTRAALVALAHKINFEVIADMVAGSDAGAGAVATWVDDASVGPRCFSAWTWDHDAVRMRLKHRRPSKCHAVWIRNRCVTMDLATATTRTRQREIMAAFALGARSSSVRWQDAYRVVWSWCGDRSTAFPTASVVVPAGTGEGVQTVITINSRRQTSGHQPYRTSSRRTLGDGEDLRYPVVTPLVYARAFEGSH